MYEKSVLRDINSFSFFGLGFINCIKFAASSDTQTSGVACEIHKNFIVDGSHQTAEASSNILPWLSDDENDTKALFFQLSKNLRLELEKVFVFLLRRSITVCVWCVFSVENCSFSNRVFVLARIRCQCCCYWCYYARKASSALELWSHKINFYLMSAKSSRFTFARFAFSSCCCRRFGCWQWRCWKGICLRSHWKWTPRFAWYNFYNASVLIKWYLPKQSTARYVYHILYYRGREKVVTDERHARIETK